MFCWKRSCGEQKAPLRGLLEGGLLVVKVSCVDLVVVAEARGFEPPKPKRLTRFRVVRLQPLGHASVFNFSIGWGGGVRSGEGLVFLVILGGGFLLP